MDRPLEEKLVAMLEAAGGMLARRDIFTRVDDDFDSEEDLARCLGRLVADGSLVRQMRARPGKADEAIYGTPKAARGAVIAAVGEKAHKANAVRRGDVLQRIEATNQAVQERLSRMSDAEPAPPSATTAPGSAPSTTFAATPKEPENDMGKRRSPEEILEAVKDAILGAREPLNQADILTAASATREVARRAIKSLVKEGLVAVHGTGRGTKYGPAAAAATPATPAVERKTKAPRPPLAEGAARFGYFSDGSLQIEAEKCNGVLTQADLEALREFTARFDK